MASDITEVVSAVPAEEVNPVPVEATDTPKVEVKTVDERAVSLANAQETAIAKSARMEGEIEASKLLSVYAAAGIAHQDTVRCWKASEDYACEKRGVATTWSPAKFDSAIGQITVRVRATNPELFEDFDALKEKPSTKPSHSNERISTRLRVGVVYTALLALIGDKVGRLPYRIVANYLIGDKVLTFSKQDVAGSIKEEHAEFLKKQLGMVCDGRSTAASFLAALKQHYEDLDKEAIAKANANKTPQQIALEESAAKAKAEGAETADKVNRVRKGLATYIAEACSGMLTPDEIGELVGQAAKKQNISLPISKLNPETVTNDELNQFLTMVATNGGKTKEERNKLRNTIVRHGSKLREAATKRAEELAAVKQPALANA